MRLPGVHVITAPYKSWPDWEPGRRPVGTEESLVDTAIYGKGPIQKPSRQTFLSHFPFETSLHRFPRNRPFKILHYWFLDSMMRSGIPSGTHRAHRTHVSIRNHSRGCLATFLILPCNAHRTRHGWRLR